MQFYWQQNVDMTVNDYLCRRIIRPDGKGNLVLNIQISKYK